VHNNVLAAQHGRGKFEGMVVQALAQVMLDLARFAQDVLLFTTAEYGFFTLAEELCTGSSIMPQKRNADIMELVRANSAVVQALVGQIMSILVGLPSGYNTDVSATKRPFMQALDTTLATVDICTLAIAGLTPDEAALRAACTPEVFATDAAYALVEQGVPFRDAYRQVGRELADGTFAPDRGALTATHLGGAGNLGLAQAREELASSRAWLDDTHRALASAAARVWAL
jgi:argininosuccinate lyase